MNKTVGVTDSLRLIRTAARDQQNLTHSKAEQFVRQTIFNLENYPQWHVQSLCLRNLALLFAKLEFKVEEQNYTLVIKHLVQCLKYVKNHESVHVRTACLMLMASLSQSCKTAEALYDTGCFLYLKTFMGIHFHDPKLQALCLLVLYQMSFHLTLHPRLKSYGFHWLIRASVHEHATSHHIQRYKAHIFENIDI